MRSAHGAGKGRAGILALLGAGALLVAGVRLVGPARVAAAPRPAPAGTPRRSERAVLAPLETLLRDALPLRFEPAPAEAPETAVATRRSPGDGLDARIAAWIADLRDDDVRWNAENALGRLRRCGERAAPALRAALSSDDRQQRQYAGHLLRQLGEPPTPELLAVTVEGLTAADIDHVALPYECTRFLIGVGRPAWPLLREGLLADSEPRRFLSAFVLATTRCPVDVLTTSQILIEHLHDNHLPCDAMMGAFALRRLGDLGRPYLVFAEPDADAQAVEVLRLVLRDIDDPPRDEYELRARKRLHHITDIYHDPALELDLSRSHGYFTSLRWR